MTTPFQPKPLDDATMALLEEGRGIGLAHYAHLGPKVDLPAHQRRWLRALDRHPRAMVLGPRAHGMTTIARILAGHRILTRRAHNVLITGRTLCGALDLASCVTCDLASVGVDLDAIGARITSKGAGGVLGDGRYDLVIHDGLVEHVCVGSSGATPEDTRDAERIGRFVEASKTRAMSGGELFVLGSCAHEGDAYDRLDADGSPFVVTRDRAMVEWPDFNRVTWHQERTGNTVRVVGATPHPASPGRALWPERWPVHELLRHWISIGPDFFRAQYQNAPHEAPEDAPRGRTVCVEAAPIHLDGRASGGDGERAVCDAFRTAVKNAIPTSR